MVHLRKLSVLVLGCSILGAQIPSEDPVLKARSERARAQGIGEGDLPPLPKGIVEPPPMPPPETHVKDTRAGRMAKTRHPGKGAKAGKAGKGRHHAAKGAPKTTKKKVKA